MKVRYEFELHKDTCADCDLMVCDDEFGYYYCCPLNRVLGQYNYKEIYARERPDWCPLKEERS